MFLRWFRYYWYHFRKLANGCHPTNDYLCNLTFSLPRLSDFIDRTSVVNSSVNRGRCQGDCVRMCRSALEVAFNFFYASGIFFRNNSVRRTETKKILSPSLSFHPPYARNHKINKTVKKKRKRNGNNGKSEKKTSWKTTAQFREIKDVVQEGELRLLTGQFQCHLVQIAEDFLEILTFFKINNSG